MKHSIYIVYLLLFSFKSSSSTVLIVNNMSAGAGVYNDATSAINAAQVGDTIYLQSISNSSSIDISKSISLMGRGYAPDTDNQLPTLVSSIQLLLNVSNVTISGIKIGYILFYGSNNLVSLYGCLIQSQITLGNSITNLAISNCVFESLFPNYSIYGSGFNCNPIYSGISNVLIQNNIFNCGIYTLLGTGVVLRNNVFISSGNAAFSGCGFDNPTLIQNNIFYGTDPNTANALYNNNLVFNPQGNAFAALGGTNLDSVLPLFVNVPLNTSQFSFSHNYHLQLSSPGHLAGNDGTDIGFYGGNTSVTLTGEPLGMPVIRSMQILQFNVNQNSNLNVKVRSTKSRNN